MPDEIFFSIVESEVGGYEARAVGHSIFAQAETTEQQKVNVKHEVHSYFDQDRMPRVIHLARVLKIVCSVLQKVNLPSRMILTIRCPKKLKTSFTESVLIRVNPRQRSRTS